MKKVLIFTYSTHVGGSEIHAYKILKILDDISFDWMVLEEANNDLTRKIKSCQNLDKYIPLGFSGFRSMKALRQIYKIHAFLKINNYEVVYAVGFIPSLIVSLIKAMHNFRLISTRRERMPWAKYYHRPFISLTELMSDYIETNSIKIKEELDHSFTTKMKGYYLQNIIIKGHSEKNSIFKKDIKYIGNVANVRMAKNIDLFLSIAHKVIQQRSDVVFIITGKDSEDSKVKNFIKKNNLLGRLLILEDISYDNIFSIYKGLNIFLFTSKYEGSPNVLNEAMSESIPVVASKIPATQEMIVNGFNGYICSLSNEQEFIEALNKLLDDKDLYNRIKINTPEHFRKRGSKHKAIEIINEKFFGLL